MGRPLGRWLSKKEQLAREKLILRLRDQGLSYVQIAAQLPGLQKGGVQTIVARMRKRDSQSSEGNSNLEEMIE